MTLADQLFDLTRRALASCSEQQRVIYQLVHGIDETGTTQPRTLESVSRLLNLSRSATRWHLAMAELNVYRLIAQTLIVQRQHDDPTEPAPITTSDLYAHGMSIRTRDKQTYANIHLGEGSTQMMRASRIGPAEHRHARYQQIHQRHTRTSSDA